MKKIILSLLAVCLLSAAFCACTDDLKSPFAPKESVSDTNTAAPVDSGETTDSNETTTAPTTTTNPENDGKWTPFL